MPGCPGEPVVTTLVCFFHFAREAMGALALPVFPAPSVVEGRKSYAQLGRIASREGRLVLFWLFEKMKSRIAVAS